MKKGIPHEYLCAYPGFGSFLHVAIQKVKVLEVFFEKLKKIKAKVGKVPLLLFRD